MVPRGCSQALPSRVQLATGTAQGRDQQETPPDPAGLWHRPRRCCSLHPQGYSIPAQDKLQRTRRVGTGSGQGDLQGFPPTSATAPTQQSQKWARQFSKTREVIPVICFWTGNRGCPWRLQNQPLFPLLVEVSPMLWGINGSFSKIISSFYSSALPPFPNESSHA